MAEEKVMKQKTKVKKNVKKRFFDVEAPLTAVKMSLYASSVEELDGKFVKLDLTRSLRGKSLELKMKVHVEGDKLKAVPMSLGLIQGYIRRATRRGTDYVEDSFEADAKDKRVRIKPFLITRKRVSRTVRNVLRENAKKFLQGHLKTRTAEEIFEEILTNKIQKEMASKLKKVYPLAMCEVRVFEVVGELEKKPEEIKE